MSRSNNLMVLGAGIVFGMLAWVVAGIRGSRRFGDAELELATVPVSLGGRLVGQIRADATLRADEALDLVLQCWASDKGGGESGGGESGVAEMRSGMTG